MNTIIFIMLFACSFAFNGRCDAMLQRIEELTKEEQMAYEKAQQNFIEAQKEIGKIREQIAIAHKMIGEHWLEWETYPQIDGKFILFYYHNFTREKEVIK